MSEITVPRGILVGGAALIGFTVATVAIARHYDIGRMETAAVDATESRELVFQPLPAGEMQVNDAQGRRLGRLKVEGDSFLMAAVRALAMQRPGHGTSDEYRLRILRDTSGHVELADPETGRSIRIEGFGEASVRTFVAYLESDR